MMDFLLWFMEVYTSDMFQESLDTTASLVSLVAVSKKSDSEDEK